MVHKDNFDKEFNRGMNGGNSALFVVSKKDVKPFNPQYVVLRKE